MNPRNVTNTTERASSTGSPPLRPAATEKTQRGYKRTKDGKQSFEKAKSVELDLRMPCAEAFRLVTGSCLRQIIANQPGMLTGHAEALHQFRIGLRRLRSAIGAPVESNGGSLARLQKHLFKEGSSNLRAKGLRNPS